MNFLHDTDQVLQAFYDFCHSSGPERCAMYDESPDAIQKRLEVMLEDIRKSPVIIPGGVDGSGPDMPELVTYSKVKKLLSNALDAPVYTFKSFAQILRALEKGDGLPYWEYLNPIGNPTPACSAETVPTDIPKLSYNTEDLFGTTICQDKGGSDFETVDEFVEFADRLMNASWADGDVNAHYRIACIGRKIKTKFRFGGMI